MRQLKYSGPTPMLSISENLQVRLNFKLTNNALKFELCALNSVLVDSKLNVVSLKSLKYAQQYSTIKTIGDLEYEYLRAFKTLIIRDLNKFNSANLQ